MGWSFVSGSVRSLSWLTFFGAILLAWFLLYQMARMSGVDMIGMPVGMNMMPVHGFGMLFLMWALMMAAMMGPSFVPTLRAYEDLVASANGTRAGSVALIFGYLSVWITFAAVIAFIQFVLLQLGIVDQLGIAVSRWVAAGLLIVVGLYQLTWMKQVCQDICMAPMHYFLGHWRAGFVGGARMGTELGSFCVGCCWGFMALGFVGGTMSLLWMGLATVLMTLEKLPQLAVFITKPLGVLLIAGGLGVAARTAGIF